MANNKVPVSVTDTLLHVKDSDRTERIILPYTKYDNILSAPTVVEDTDSRPGAPFLLLQTSTVTLTDDELNELLNRS